MGGRTLCQVIWGQWSLTLFNVNKKAFNMISFYLTGKEQLHEDLQKLTEKTQPDWPSFNATSQHKIEADNAVFLHLYDLQILGRRAEEEANKLWMADCFIKGCAYASRQGSDMNGITDPFYIVNKVAETLHVLPLRRLVPDSIFCFYPSVNPY